MKYLLDVSAFAALGYAGHSEHATADKWLTKQKNQGAEFFVCSISELGFLRVGVGGKYVPDWQSAVNAMRRVAQSIPAQFLADDEPTQSLPRAVKTGNDATDAHLLRLAKAQGMALATADRPLTALGAVLIV